MSKNLSSIVNPVDQIISELFKYINNFRISNKLNIFSRDRMSEHILSLLFRGKKEPPKDNDIEAKFVSYGCAFVDKIIHRISVVGNNSPNYQQYCSLIQQEINTNKNSPLLSNGNYTHMGFYIKNIEINFFIIFVFSTKILSFDRVIGCQDGNVLEGTIFKPDHFVEGINVKDIDSIRGIPFGPKNIRYNQNNNKFYIPPAAARSPAECGAASCRGCLKLGLRRGKARILRIPDQVDLAGLAVTVLRDDALGDIRAL